MAFVATDSLVPLPAYQEHNDLGEISV